MITKAITVPEEINKLLILEENQSGLIVKLLRKHYIEGPNDIEKERKRLKNEWKMADNELKETLLIELKEKKVEEEVVEKTKDKKEQLIKNCIINTKEVFGRTITPIQANEFLTSTVKTPNETKPKYESIPDYLESIGSPLEKMTMED